MLGAGCHSLFGSGRARGCVSAPTAMTGLYQKACWHVARAHEFFSAFAAWDAHGSAC